MLPLLFRDPARKKRGENWQAAVLGAIQSRETPLPEPITRELLERLHIPQAMHERLIRIETQEALLECPVVPDDVLLRIDEVMFELE